MKFNSQKSNGLDALFKSTYEKFYLKMRSSFRLSIWPNGHRGYQERRPDTFEAELKRNLNQKLAPVTDVMDYNVRLSTEAYAGAAHVGDFAIFHDGLSAWWEAGAQAHMKTLDFEHRQIRSITANKGARYKGKIVGGSPEMCRAIDSQGFADLKAAIMVYSYYTYVLTIGKAPL
jgi:hypothetical protein